MRRRGALGAIALGGLIAAGCAIPTQQAPSTISPSRVPPGLVSPAIPTTSTTQPRLSSEVPVKIFLLGPGDVLVPRNRVVLVPAPLSSIITSMLAGPDHTEIAQGLTTAIPNDVAVLSAVTKGTEVTVSFNDAFGQITGGDTELAVAQVVATVVTQIGLGTGVLFEIDGQAISVPIASGAQVPGPVYLWQFLTRAT